MDFIDRLLQMLEVGIGGACASLGVDLEAFGQGIEVAEQIRFALAGIAPTCGLGG